MKEYEELKKEVGVWKRKYNQMADRVDRLQSQINDLRIRLETEEDYTKTLRKHVFDVVIR